MNLRCFDVKKRKGGKERKGFGMRFHFSISRPCMGKRKRQKQENSLTPRIASNTNKLGIIEKKRSFEEKGVGGEVMGVRDYFPPFGKQSLCPSKGADFPPSVSPPPLSLNLRGGLHRGGCAVESTCSLQKEGLRGEAKRFLLEVLL